MAATSGRPRRDGIVADHAADLFHQIVFDRNVFGRAPARHRHREYAGLGLWIRRTPVIPEWGGPRRSRYFAPELAHPASRAASAIGGGAGLAAYASAKPPTSRMPGETCFSSSMARAKPRTRVHRILRFLEAHGRVGAQLQCRRCLADARRLEVRALEHDARGRRPMIALSCPPMTPAIAIGPSASAITRFDGSARRFRRSAPGSFARAARAHVNRVAAQLVAHRTRASAARVRPSRSSSRRRCC